MTRLLGQSPAGLSATGDADTRNYYDMIAARQEIDLRPQLERLDRLILRSEGIDPFRVRLQRYGFAQGTSLLDLLHGDSMARRPARAKTAGSEQPTTTFVDPATLDTTLAIRDAIRAHVPEAIRELARLAREATSEQARVSAINALIDRGYGDLKHATDADETAGIVVRFVTPSDTA